MGLHGSPVEILTGSEADADELLAIAGELRDWFTDGAIAAMPVDFHFQGIYKAVSDGETVGFVSFYVAEAVGHIGWVAVLPGWQGKGVGSALLRRLEADLVSRGVGKLRVSTLDDSVDYEPYERTRRFYRARGFGDFQRIAHPDNPSCPEELILQKVLTGP